jgi:hypothetical protein
MKKNEVKITKNTDGTVTIESSGFSRKIWIRAKSPLEKVEAVRAVILEEGLVFTEKIERMAQKELT